MQSKHPHSTNKMLIFYLKRLTILAIIVAIEADVVPILIISATLIFLDSALEGTTISQPGCINEDLYLLSLATVPFI